MLKKKVIFGFLLLCIFALSKVTGADHKSAVRIHSMDPCPHLELPDGQTRKTRRVPEGYQCCGCPPNSFYSEACVENSPNTTECFPCPDGLVLSAFAHLEGRNKCVQKPPVDLIPVQELTTDKPPVEMKSNKNSSSSPSNDLDPSNKQNDTHNGFPWNIVGPIIGGIMVLILVVVVVLCCRKHKTSCLYDKKKGVGDNSVGSDSGNGGSFLGEFEAGQEPGSSRDTFSTGVGTRGNNTPAVDQNRRQDGVFSTVNERRKESHESLPTGSDGEVENLTLLQHVSGRSTSKNLADPLQTPYSDPATVREPPTQIRYQGASNSQTQHDQENEMPEFRTRLSVTIQKERVSGAFSSMRRRNNIPLRREDVKHFGRHFKLNDDLINAADRDADTTSGFLVEVFKDLCTTHGTSLTAAKVLKFFWDNKLLGVYELLLDELRKP